MKSYFFSYTIFFVFTTIALPHSNAQPSWELYENERCAISLMHPYKDDRISQGLAGNFKIISSNDSNDLDSLNMNITTSCLDERLPITEESMNLTMSGLKKEFKLVTYEENSFNQTLIDDEKASFVTVGGPQSGEHFRAHTVAEINHNNNTYIIRIVSSGDDGLSGFFNNHNYLKDNVLGSIKFSK